VRHRGVCDDCDGVTGVTLYSRHLPRPYAQVRKSTPLCGRSSIYDQSGDETWTSKTRNAAMKMHLRMSLEAESETRAEGIRRTAGNSA